MKNNDLTYIIEEKIKKILSLISIVLWFVLIIYFLVHLFFLDFNKDIFNWDYYILIWVLFLFWFWWNEFITIIKNKIDKNIKKYFEDDNTKEGIKILIEKSVKNNMESFEWNMIRTYQEIVEDSQSKYDEDSQSKYEENTNEINKEELSEYKKELLKKYILSKNFENISDKIKKDDLGKKTGLEIVKLFIKLLSENKIKKFTIDDIYSVLIEIIIERFPNNQYPDAKIRQLLQKVRDEKIIEFIAKWKYRII